MHAGRSRGQGGAPDWTNDLDAGEDRRRIGRREGPDDVVRSWSRMHPFGPRRGVRMTVVSGPGLLSQLNGRIAGSCGNASAPGGDLLGGGLLQLGEDVKAAGQQLAGDCDGGDLPAAAVGDLGVGAGERRLGLGPVGRLPGRIQRTHTEPCLVMWPWRTLRSELRTAGVSPAQAHSLRALGNRSMSPISATSVMAVSRPTPGRAISAWTRGSGLARAAIWRSSRAIGAARASSSPQQSSTIARGIAGSSR